MKRMVSMVGVALAVSTMSAAVCAQSTNDSGNTRAQRERESETRPNDFRGPQAVTSTEVGSGSTTANSQGPVGELRGDSSAPDQITGPIGPGDVARLMQIQMPRLRPCYEHALTAHPELQGRIEVRFTIAANGTVSRAAAYGLPEAPEVATCIADLLRQTTFPRPQNGPLPFIYPLTFALPPAPAHHGHAAAHSTRATARH